MFLMNVWWCCVVWLLFSCCWCSCWLFVRFVLKLLCNLVLNVRSGVFRCSFRKWYGWVLMCWKCWLIWWGRFLLIVVGWNRVLVSLVLILVRWVLLWCVFMSNCVVLMLKLKCRLCLFIRRVWIVVRLMVVLICWKWISIWNCIRLLNSFLSLFWICWI